MLDCVILWQKHFTGHVLKVIFDSFAIVIWCETLGLFRPILLIGTISGVDNICFFLICDARITLLILFCEPVQKYSI